MLPYLRRLLEIKITMKVASRRRSPKGIPLESPDTLRARLEAFALKTRDESIRYKALVDNGLVVVETEHGVLVGPLSPEPLTEKTRR